MINPLLALSQAVLADAEQPSWKLKDPWACTVLTFWLLVMVREIAPVRSIEDLLRQMGNRPEHDPYLVTLARGSMEVQLGTKRRVPRFKLDKELLQFWIRILTAS